MSCTLITGHPSAGLGKLSCRQCNGLKRKGIFLRPKFRRLRVSAQGTSSENWEREEARWLREEERWKREEQRWLREEQRWSTEAARMKEEIISLKQEIETLKQVPQKQESSSTLRDVPLDLKGLLQTLSSSETGTAEVNRPPVELPKAEQSVESIKFILSEPPKAEAAPVSASKKDKKPEQRTLKQGAEGEDVKLLQEALAELGFYCGEDDMEYSSFSSGTDRAVKSWQASVGAPEDGMVTAKVFSQLINGEGVVTINSSAVLKTSETSSSVSENRVYLLGENRWEDPNRLLKRNQKTASTAQKCLTCRGEGRSLCSECEGTGELNVEEQFLEWAGEGAKCPYCEGSGTVVCDVCDGKGTN